MAISCPGCGRPYDVTLFQFGRTIHCTCGGRVGLEHRIGPPLDLDGPRFIADAMLGRLARWLRTLGWDMVYDAHISDEDLVRRAVTQNRHLLTRDRRLFEEWRIGGGLEVWSDRSLAQLEEVVRAFALPPPVRFFTRCTVCNGVLEPVARDTVRALTPERVWERQIDFSRCPGCGRVYWEGSHTKRMRSVLDRLFGR